MDDQNNYEIKEQDSPSNDSGDRLGQAQDVANKSRQVEKKLQKSKAARSGSGQGGGGVAGGEAGAAAGEAAAAEAAGEAAAGAAAGGGGVGATTSAAAGVAVGAAATTEAGGAAAGGAAGIVIGGGWIIVIILLIILLLLLFLGLLVAVMGAGQQVNAGEIPVCDGISTNSTSSPYLLTANNCTFAGAIVYNWSANVISSFSNPVGQNTTFTTSATNGTVKLTACDASNLNNCNYYTFDIGTPTTTTYPTPNCATVDQRLLNDFGVKLSGQTVSCSGKQTLYKMYAIPFQSATYKKYLKPQTPFTIELLAKNNSCTASGYTPSGYKIQAWGFAYWLNNNCPFKAGAIFILHETGHVLGSRNYTLFHQQFPYSSLLSSTGSCFFPSSFCKYRIAKTYSICWDNAVNETFAEFNSLYMFNSKNGKYYSISDFRSQCKPAWDYYYNGLFGGTIIKP